MQTRFFCFPDMPTAFALAQAAGLTTSDEQGQPMLVRHTHDYALDVVGDLYLPTGEMTVVESHEVPVMRLVPGWHVNARILNGDPLPASFAAFEVFPETPARDFA